MKQMLKGMLCALLACLALPCAAMADGYGEWLESLRYGYVRFASYAGEYDGYVDVDGMGGITAADPYWLQVISKSASIWSEPRTNSKKLGSASHGESLLCRNAESEEDMWMENGFYAVAYKGKEGWVNEDYVVRNTLEIVLMESNVPAYIAPDTHSKKVGSLAKLTRYRVIGIYDDFYIINLRGAAAAYIPMDVQHYDTRFEALHRQAPSCPGTTTQKTAVRTGPGTKYAKLKDVKAGYAFDAIDCIDGWYVFWTADAGTDGGAYVYIDSDDAQVSGMTAPLEY